MTRRYPSLEACAWFCSLMLLNLADCFVTTAGITSGQGVEGNPIPAALMASLGLGRTMVIKVAFVAVLGLLAVCQWERRTAQRCAYLSLLYFTAVVLDGVGVMAGWWAI